MSLLLDTHFLIWIADDSPRLSPDVRLRLRSQEGSLLFSAASLWEIAIKNNRRNDFQVDGAELRRGLLARRYEELPVTGAHALETATLPPIHDDPFDRILVAQARCEGLTLLTADRRIARYPGPIELV